MLHPKSLCHMNVIPPYGRPALIRLVTSMDDSEKEFTSTPSVDGTARSKGRAMFPAELPSHTKCGPGGGWMICHFSNI